MPQTREPHGSDDERNAPLSDDLMASYDGGVLASPTDTFTQKRAAGEDGADGDVIFTPHNITAADGEHAKNLSSSDASSDDLDALARANFGSHYEPKSPFMRALNCVVPHGGCLANVYSLAAVTLGSGIIALPGAFESTGVMLAVIVLVCLSSSTVYSVFLMARATDRTKRTMFTYEQLSRGLLGPGWDFFAAFNQWFFCFGSCVSYVISLGDLLGRATDGDNVMPFFRSAWGNRVLVIIIWAVVMLPLSIPKQINTIRWFSIVGVMSMVYFVIVIVIHAALNGFEDGKAKHKLTLFKGGNNSIVGFSTYIFAFLCNTNAPEVYREAKNPRPVRLARDTSISMAGCCILYILAGVFGNLDFGEAIEGKSILLFYNVRTDPLVAIAYIGIGIKMCVGFAICMQPSRDAVYYCLKWWKPMFADVQTVPFWLNAAICSFMAIVALILGLAIPNVSIVFGLVGSFGGGFLGFVYPALFIMYAGKWTLKTQGYFHFFATYALLIAGVIIVSFGFVAAIYGLV